MMFTEPRAMRISRIVTAVLLLLICAATGLPQTASAKGKGNKDRVRENVKWEVVPAPVQETIRANAKDGKIGAIEKETRRGEVTYEAEVKKTDGTTISIEVAENGKLISVEEEPSSGAPE